MSEDCFGIPNEEGIVTEPWQFCILQGQHGRAHGFIMNNVFYIRWFDPEHKLYLTIYNALSYCHCEVRSNPLASYTSQCSTF